MNNYFLKQKYIIYIVVGISSFFVPIVPSLIAVGCFSVLDFITGIIKAHKKSEVSSSRMIDKLYDALGYYVAIMAARLVEMLFGVEDLLMVKAVVAIVALTEIQSLRENIKEITGVDLLKSLVKLIPSGK